MQGLNYCGVVGVYDDHDEDQDDLMDAMEGEVGEWTVPVGGDIDKHIMHNQSLTPDAGKD